METALISNDININKCFAAKVVIIGRFQAIKFPLIFSRLIVLGCSNITKTYLKDHTIGQPFKFLKVTHSSE